MIHSIVFSNTTEVELMQKATMGDLIEPLRKIQEDDVYLAFLCHVSSNFLYSQDELSCAGSLGAEPMFVSENTMLVKMSPY